MAQVDIKQQEKVLAVMEEHFNDPDYCDIRIIADDGTEFYCAKYALRCGSEVFHKMLSHNMKENISGEVYIRHVASDIIRVILCFMHSGKCSLISTNLVPVMSIALRYQVNHLVSLCKEYQNKHFSVDQTNCFFILNQAYMFPEMPQALRRQCQHVILKILAVEQRDFTVWKEFLGLSHQIIEDIAKTALSYMLLRQPFPVGYVNFALALLEWLDHDKTHRHSKALSLLSSLEFEGLGVEGIAKISSRKFPQTNWVREHPALEQKVLNALSYASRNPINYSTSTAFNCEPGRWSFVCKASGNVLGKIGNTVMATFNLEEAMPIYTYFSQRGTPGCALYIVCKANVMHVLLAAGEGGNISGTFKSMFKGNASSENRCCAFSHDAEAGQPLSHIPNFQLLPFSYVHPLAVEVEKLWDSSHQSIARVLARPNISTAK